MLCSNNHRLLAAPEVASGPSEEELALQVAQMEVFWNVGALYWCYTMMLMLRSHPLVHQRNFNEPRRYAHRPHPGHALIGSGI